MFSSVPQYVVSYLENRTELHIKCRRLIRTSDVIEPTLCMPQFHLVLYSNTGSVSLGHSQVTSYQKPDADAINTMHSAIYNKSQQ